jgi:hypothetical protein
MANLTESAKHCLDDYLGEVRASLHHCPSVDVGEVERDVVEHIEHVLAGAPAPIDAPELREVLRKLGSPRQWVPQEEMSRLQRALLALRSGPEDLRLGYLALGLLAGTFLVAACLNLVAPFETTLPFLLLGIALSFVFARACLSAAKCEHGAERWLISPALIVVYLPLLAILLLWPAAAAFIAEDFMRSRSAPSDPFFWVSAYRIGTIGAFLFVLLSSIWFACIGFIAWRWPVVVRNCFAPFADKFSPGLRVLASSVVCLLTFLASLAYLAAAFRGESP